MANISFYAKKPFLGNAYQKLTGGLTIWRLSSVIRGQQMAEYLGGKFNPAVRTEGHVHIFLKPNSLSYVMDRDYVDYNDPDAENNLEGKLRQRPLIKVIANCQYSYEYLSKRLSHELFCIPQQHLNWENQVNPKRGMLRGGYVGRPSNTSYKVNKEVQDVLAEIGIDFEICYNWTSRKDAVDFYKRIDFLVLAPEGIERYDSPFTTPTKMINAASFGVPTFAYRKKGYKEFEGYYIPYETMKDLLYQVNRFKDEAVYKEFSDKILAKASEYHISKIADKYLQLK